MRCQPAQLFPYIKRLLRDGASLSSCATDAAEVGALLGIPGLIPQQAILLRQMLESAIHVLGVGPRTRAIHALLGFGSMENASGRQRRLLAARIMLDLEHRPGLTEDEMKPFYKYWQRVLAEDLTWALLAVVADADEDRPVERPAG